MFFRLLFAVFSLLMAVMPEQVLSQDNKINRRILLSSTSKYTPGSWLLRDSLIRDTSACRIYYQCRFVMDTLRPEKNATVMVCDIGPNYLSYFSLAMRFRNTVFTKVQEEADRKGRHLGINIQYPYTEQERALEKFAGDVGSINSEIWIDCRHRTLTERASDYANENMAYAYEEPLPVLDWEISEERRQIGSYDCIKAVCRFRGRDWTAWFTPEIPLFYGPWKLGGLPGLILQAEDSQKHYTWECCGLDQTARPMAYHIIPTRHVTRKQFNAWMLRFHHFPYEVIDGGMGRTLIQTYSAQGLRDLDDSWTIPYNPIERE